MLYSTRTMFINVLVAAVVLTVSEGAEGLDNFGSYMNRGIDLITNIMAKLSARNHAQRRITCNLPSSNLTSSQQVECVDEHNRLREVAGSVDSADEAKMEWNQNLADLAQNLTDKCSFYHGDVYLCDGTRVGQNLAVTTAKHASPSYYINRWYDEVDYYNYVTGGCTITEDNRSCGHYTQVVWHTSNKVGCAQTFCETAVIDKQNNITWNDAVIFACNYYPAGNLQGDKPYINGTICSECDKVIFNNTYKCEYGLCAGCNPATDTDCGCIKNECANGEPFNNQTCMCTSCNESTCGNVCERYDVSSNSHCDYWKELGYCHVDSVYYLFMRKECYCTCDFKE